jgi:hypothetical protein
VRAAGPGEVDDAQALLELPRSLDEDAQRQLTLRLAYLDVVFGD